MRLPIFTFAQFGVLSAFTLDEGHQLFTGFSQNEFPGRTKCIKVTIPLMYSLFSVAERLILSRAYPPDIL